MSGCHEEISNVRDCQGDASFTYAGVMKRLGAVLHAPDALCCAPLRVRVIKCECLRRNRASSVRIAKPAACYSTYFTLLYVGVFMIGGVYIILV